MPRWLPVRCDCHDMRRCPLEGRRASGRQSWDPKGKGRPMAPKSRAKADAPRACGKACGPYDRRTKTRATCTGVIRAGQCSCAYC